MVPTTSPPLASTTEKKDIKACRKQIRLALIKDLSMILIEAVKIITPLNECSPFERIFSPFRDEEILPLTEIFYLGKSMREIEVQDMI